MAATSAAYRVQLDVYEGPLDLLLDLLDKNRVSIWDVSITTVINQYLGYLATMNDLNLRLASDFLVMAVRLLRIKALMLLPGAGPAEAEDGEEGAHDPRAELAVQLLEYRRYKLAALSLLELLERRRRTTTRLDAGCAPPRRVWFFSDAAPGVTLSELREVLADLLREASRAGSVALVPRAGIDVPARISYVLSRLSAERVVRFSQLLRNETRAEIVGTFLAVLEIARLGLARARQDTLFGQLELSLGEEGERC